jgi:hypothetical protein
MESKEVIKLLDELDKAEEDRDKMMYEYYKKEKARTYHELLKFKEFEVLDKNIHNIKNKMKEKGLILGCEDYNGEYCLSKSGLRKVLEVLNNGN